MQSIGDEGGRADAAPDADAVDRDELVADEADEPGGGDPGDVIDPDGVDQAAHRFDRGDRGGQGDHGDHEQAGQIFGATEPVGVAAGGSAPAQGERDPQRDSGQRVGEVVDGVGQQRDRAGDQNDHQLRDRGGAERKQADLHRADTGGAGFQRPIDAVGGVVAVRCEDLPAPPHRTCPLVAVPVFVAAVDSGTVPVPAVVVLLVVRHPRCPLRRAGVESEAVSGCRVRSSSVLR